MDQTAIGHDTIDQMIVETSWRPHRYVVVTRNKKYIQISAMAYDILKRVRAGHSFATIAQTMSGTEDTNITEDAVQLAYQHILEKIQTIDNRTESKPKNFWIRIPFLPARWVTTISSHLTFLFHPVVILVFLSSFLLLLLIALHHGLLNVSMSLTVESFLLVYSLYLFSLLAHEFGHASACACGGVEPSEIGFTVYLVFPAFYSNVSASWTLPRWKKVRVDVAGIYFQLWVGVIYLSLYLLLGLPIFQFAFFAILSSCLLSLNPLARFDGYWIVSDILGITNLSRRPSELLRYCYHVVRKKPRQALPYSFGTACIIAIYGVLRTGLVLSFVATTAPFLWQAILTYPQVLTSTLSAWQSGQLANVLTNGEILGSSTLLLLLWSLSLLFLSLPLLHRGTRLFSRRAK